MTTRGHEYPQPRAKLIRHPKNQREQTSTAPSPEEREGRALPCAGALGVAHEKTGVGFWLVADKYAPRLLKRQGSACKREAFDLFCVASSNWTSELSEMRKKKYPRHQ